MDIKKIHVNKENWIDSIQSRDFWGSCNPVGRQLEVRLAIYVRGLSLIKL